MNGTGEEGDEYNRGNDGYPSSDPNQLQTQYDNGNGDYSNNHQEIPEGGFQSTPIYANNQSTFRTGQWAESQNAQGNSYDREGTNGENETVGNGSRLSTEGFKDTAADEWGRSAGAAIAGAASVGASGTGNGNDEVERETQAAQEAYRNTDDNLEDEYSRTPVGESALNRDEAATTTNSHNPRSRQNTNEVAPTLPPISTSTPLPGASTAGAMTPISPSATNDSQQDDASYFASIGSTRAAQAAVRRPNSPPVNSTRYSGVPTVAVSQPALASASVQKVYEPNPEGRKMTAAAFRKGFNRVPSAQNVNPSGSTSFGSAIARQNSAGQDDTSTSNVGDESNASSSIQPLAIKKRNSYQPVDENTDGIDHPAPPYMPGGPAHGSAGPHVPYDSNLNVNNSEEPRASVYGGMNDDYSTNNVNSSRRQSYQSAQTSQPQQQYSYNDPYSNGPGVPQPWTQGNGSRPNSRPGSAQGSRPLPPNSSSNNYYPSYPTSGY